jgi:hypothetical protein
MLGSICRSLLRIAADDAFVGHATARDHRKGDRRLRAERHVDDGLDPEVLVVALLEGRRAHADDREPRSVEIFRAAIEIDAETNTLAERILVGEPLRHERLVDDGCFGAGCAVAGSSSTVGRSRSSALRRQGFMARRSARVRSIRPIAQF